MTTTTIPAPKSDAPDATADAAAAAALPAGEFELRIGGKPYRLKPTLFSSRDEKERLILSLRPTLAKKLAEAAAVPEQFQQRAIDQVFATHQQRLQLVDFEEEALFDRSALGVAWGFWLAARAHHPELTSLDEARKVLDNLSQAEAVALMTILGTAA